VIFKNLCPRLLISITVFSLIVCCLSACKESPSVIEARKNSLIYAQSEEPSSLDSARAGDVPSSVVIFNIYESLLKFKEGTLEMVPNLAKSWKESEDHLSYDFKLREDVEFHDGTKFDAEAVKFNIERQLELNRDEDMPYAVAVYGVVKDVEVLDRYSVRLNLKEVCSYFLKSMAMDIGAFMASPEAIKKSKNNDITKNPVGTGPYKYLEWKRGQNIRLVRNEKYWGEKAQVKNLFFKFIKDASSRVVALLSGEVDIIEKVDVDSAERIKSEGKAQLCLSDVLGTHYMAFNTQRAPFNNKEARHAVCQCINTEELVRTVCRGYAKRALSLLPELIPGHNKNVKYPSYDQDAAKAALGALGLKKIKILSLSSIGTFGSDQQWAEAVQSYLQKVGVESEIEACDLKTYRDKLSTERDFDLCFYRWISDNGDADNFLQILSKDNPELNFSRYESDRFEEILNTGKSTPYGPERDASYVKAEKLLSEDIPLLPLFYNKEISALAHGVKNFILNPTGTIKFALISKI
jgi:peptide/nickel transport system substrate-binding protein